GPARVLGMSLPSALGPPGGGGAAYGPAGSAALLERQTPSPGAAWRPSRLGRGPTAAWSGPVWQGQGNRAVLAMGRCPVRRPGERSARLEGEVLRQWHLLSRLPVSPFFSGKWPQAGV